MVEQIHTYVNELTRYQYSNEVMFEQNDVPNGVYFIFEKGETFMNYDRIVRIGSHRGGGNLIKRINEHFTNENKDRSIFRKHVGRSILNKREDAYLPVWEIDFTPRARK